MISVSIGSALQGPTDGRADFAVEASDVAEVVARIDALCPGFRNAVVGQSGNLRSNVYVYRAADDSYLEAESAVQDGESLTISMRAVAGG